MLQLHLAVMLFGAAALVAQSTQLDALALALGRCLVAAPLLLGLARWRSGGHRAWPGLRHGLGAGALLAFHWAAFFQAMRLGGVAVALLSYAAFPAFSLLVERLLPTQTREHALPAGWQGLQLLLLTFGLLLLALPHGGQGSHLPAALAWGLASGAGFALLAHWNARLRSLHGALALTGSQVAGAALLLLPFALPALATATLHDWAALLLLGLMCTALGHGLFQWALGRVSPFQAGIAAGLEPVYGLLLMAGLGQTVEIREWVALPLMALAAFLPLFGKTGMGRWVRRS